MRCPVTYSIGFPRFRASAIQPRSPPFACFICAFNSCQRARRSAIFASQPAVLGV